MDFLLKFSNIYPKSKVCIKTVQVFSNKLPLELRGCLHEISFRAKWNILISVSSQFLITVCIIKPEMKLPVGVISLRTFSQKWNFIWGDKVSCKRYPKWNHMKRNNCNTETRMIGFYLMGHLPRTTPGNDIQFISSTMKSNVNKFILSWVGISFRVDFISDLM